MLIVLSAVMIWAGLFIYFIWMVPFRDDASDAPFIIAHPQGGLAPDRKARKGERFFISTDVDTSKGCFLDKIYVQIVVPSVIEVENVGSQQFPQFSQLEKDKFIWQGNLKDNAEISIDFPLKTNNDIDNWSNPIIFYERVNFRTTRNLPKWPSGCYERSFCWPKCKDNTPNTLDWKRCLSENMSKMVPTRK